MKFTRKTLPWNEPVDDPAALCRQLDSGIWLVEAGGAPIPSHRPGQLIHDASLGHGMALSLSSASAIRLSLGPALIDRLAQHGAAVGPLSALALHELVGNAVIHGNLRVSSGRAAAWADLAERQAAITEALRDPGLATRLVTVVLAWSGERVVAVVADEGEGYQAAALDPPRAAGVRASGRGLRIARAVGQIEVLCGGRQTALTLARLAAEVGA